MRIAMISPLELRVPPIGYGGTELVVSLLTEELVTRGHHVTLFASGDSLTSAELVSVSPTFLRGSGRDIGLLNMLNVATCLEMAGSFDIIHNHTALEGMSTAGLVDTPMLTSLHGAVGGDYKEVFDFYKGWHCTISRSAKSLLPPKDRFAGVVHNAIDCASYPFHAGPREDFLLFLSRMSEEKGPHLAIEVAKRLGKRLVLAGNVHTPDRPFFESQVLPLVDGELIQYVGEASVEMKKDLFRRASCLLAPICWEEPFGLFMVESMACGTPVVAISRGAAPEVVSHGRTGYLVQNVDEMVEAVKAIGEIDPAECRRHVEQQFHITRMADDYLDAYLRVLQGEEARPEAALQAGLELGVTPHPAPARELRKVSRAQVARQGTDGLRGAKPAEKPVPPVGPAAASPSLIEVA